MFIDGQQRKLLMLLSLASFMNYTDRMVLPAVAQAVKQEFSLSDTTLGVLSGFVFVALYGIASLPLATLADRSSRSRVLAGALAFWSVATGACGLANSFLQLAIARACVGIGESACQPIGYALVSEQIPAERRNVAMGWFLLGNNLGLVAGFAIGGWIGAHYGWRTAFLVVGLPGLLIAAALAQFGTSAALSQRRTPRVSLVDAALAQFSNPRYCALVLLSGVFAFTIFGPIAFLPAFFVRSHGLSIALVGPVSGLAIGLGMTVGVLIGGGAADRLAQRGAEQPQWLCAGAILASGATFVLALTLSNPWLAFAATFVACLFGSIASPIIAAAVQNESPEEVRAVSAAFGTLAVSLLGIGLAPLAIGMLSDSLAARYGNESLRHALILSLTVCVLVAAMHVTVGRMLRQACREASMPSPWHQH